MCDCNDYSSCSSDNELNRRDEKAVAGLSHKLVPLNFATYEMCGDFKQLELGVQLTQFDSNKLSVVKDKENPNNFDVLYYGRKFCLFLKAFPGIVKRSTYFAREKHLKIKDRCQSKVLWKVFWNISDRVMQLVEKEEKFCWFLEWYRIWLNFCDRRLAQIRIYYFEEASVAIDKVVMIEESQYSKEFRLIAEMIDAHVILPNESACLSNQNIKKGDKEEIILSN